MTSVCIKLWVVLHKRQQGLFHHSNDTIKMFQIKSYETISKTDKKLLVSLYYNVRYITYVMSVIHLAITWLTDYRNRVDTNRVDTKVINCQLTIFHASITGLTRRPTRKNNSHHPHRLLDGQSKPLLALSESHDIIRQLLICPFHFCLTFLLENAPILVLILDRDRSEWIGLVPVQWKYWHRSDADSPFRPIVCFI